MWAKQGGWSWSQDGQGRSHGRGKFDQDPEAVEKEGQVACKEQPVGQCAQGTVSGLREAEAGGREATWAPAWGLAESW